MNESLAVRNIIPSAVCIRCGEIETIEHVFFKCQFAQDVWRKAPFKDSVVLDDVGDFTAGWERVQQASCLPPVGLKTCNIAAWIVWTIWIARNHKIFREKVFSEQEVITKALVEAKEWEAAQIQPKAT